MRNYVRKTDRKYIACGHKVIKPPKSDEPKKPSDFHAATIVRDVDYTPAELEWMKAVDTYKRESGKPFPTLCELLRVASSLGYKKSEASNATRLV